MPLWETFHHTPRRDKGHFEQLLVAASSTKDDTHTHTHTTCVSPNLARSISRRRPRACQVQQQQPVFHLHTTGWRINHVNLKSLIAKLYRYHFIHLTVKRKAKEGGFCRDRWRAGHESGFRVTTLSFQVCLCVSA